MKKTCRKCRETKDISDFYIRRGRIKDNKITESCYGSECKQCFIKRIVDANKNQKQFCLDYKGNKCEKCGYDKCIWALEFHHLDPSKKEFQVCRRKRNMDSIIKELDKCILVCANCHREIHCALDKASS